MAIRPMTDMEFDDEDTVDQAFPSMPERPRYPYGLRISLTEKELAKLGSDGSELEKDGIIHGHFLARITNVTHSDGEFGKSCRVEMQIEDLSVESEDGENEDDE